MSRRIPRDREERSRDAIHTRVEGITLVDDHRNARWCMTTVRDVIADGAILDGGDARGADLLRLRVHAGSLRSMIFDGSRIDSCDFSRSNLERTSWRDARIFRSRFDGGMLVDASVENAWFEECSFRGVDLARINLGTRARTRGATFVGCDLREVNWDRRSLDAVTFADCRLHGAHGRPELGRVHVTNADISIRGDGSLIESDVQRIWQAPAEKSSRDSRIENCSQPETRLVENGAAMHTTVRSERS